MIKPTIDGVVNLFKSCVKAKTVKRVVYTSTAATVNIQPFRKTVYDETSWTDVEFCKNVKMTSWVIIIVIIIIIKLFIEVIYASVFQLKLLKLGLCRCISMLRQ